MSAGDIELLEIFRGEAQERLDRFVDTLLAVERGTPPPEAVDALFREAHTIKGAAGMVGEAEVHALAHQIEDVLASARGEDTFPVSLVEPLLAAADEIRRHVDGRPAPREANGVKAANGHAPPARQAASAAATAPDQRSIRLPAEKIDRLLDVVGETVLHRRRLEHQLLEADSGPARAQAVADELDAGERLFDDLRDMAIGLRTLPLSSIVGRFPRAVRDLAAEQGKAVDLAVSGAETELDRVLLERLAEPLVHVLRNAVAHGIELPEERRSAGKPERGVIEIRAEQRGSIVEIVVSDDGRGVSPEILEEARHVGSLADVLARPGYSTADSVTDLAGRGVGLDAVKEHVEGCGGTFAIRSEPGLGTAIVLQLPVALALIDVLTVERGASVYCIPLAAVEEVVAAEEPLVLGGREAVDLRGRSLPLVDLAEALGADASPLPGGSPAIVVAGGTRRLAVACDRLLREEEVLLKGLGPLLAGVHGYLGAAILGDGGIALVLDPLDLTQTPLRRPRRPASPPAAVDAAEALPPKVLVVEDSLTVRELQRGILQAAGYRVETARDGREALACVSRDEEIDLVLTDVEMPELDGLALTRAIRAHATRSSLPVVILTSRGSEDDRRAGVEAGADAYMVKRAFDQQALLDTVERFVGR
jgi:two-component system chemotaxis sensor kinase CheA